MKINEEDIQWDIPKEKPTINEEDIQWEKPKKPNAFLSAVKTAGNYAQNIGDVLAHPINTMTKGLDGIEEDRLKQKALDLIAKADSLDESSLYSSQIKSFINKDNLSQEDYIELEKLQQKRLLEYDKILQVNGLGQLGLNEKNEKILVMGNKEIPLENLIDTLQADSKANAGTIMGAIAGASKGSNYGSTPATKIGGALIGGAVGAFTGSVADTTINAFELDRDIDAKFAFKKATEEAMADPILTVLTAGVFKVAGKGLKLPFKVAKKVKSYIADGNIDTAKKVIAEQGYDEAATKEIVEQTAKFQHTPKESWAINQEAEDIQDMFVDVAGQDAVLFNDLEKVIIQSPDLAKPVRDTVVGRTAKIQKELEKRSANSTQIRGTIKDYETSVKAEYKQTKELISESLPEARFNLTQTNIPQALESLQGRVGNDAIESELKALLTRIKDNSDMDVIKFIDIREDINRILRKPSVAKSFKDSKTLGSIKLKLDDSIYEALESAPLDVGKMKLQFEKAITRYRKMKQLQGTKLHKNIMGDEKTDEEIAKALMKGSKSVDSTLDKLLKKLSAKDREAVEHSVVYDIFKKSQMSFNDVTVTDFVKLKKELSNIDMKNIKSKSTRETIETLQDMGKWFKNDPKLLEATTKSADPTMNQGISQDPFVRYRTKVANFLTDYITMYSPMRMGRSPSFRFHLKKSLKKKRGTTNFLNEMMKHKDVPETLLNSLQKTLKEYQKEIVKQADPKAKVEQKNIQQLIDEMAKRVEESKPKVVQTQAREILPPKLSDDLNERAAQLEYAKSKGQAGIDEYLLKLEKQKPYDPYDLGIKPTKIEEKPLLQEPTSTVIPKVEVAAPKTSSLSELDIESIKTDTTIRENMDILESLVDSRPAQKKLTKAEVESMGIESEDEMAEFYASQELKEALHVESFSKREFAALKLGKADESLKARARAAVEEVKVQREKEIATEANLLFSKGYDNLGVAFASSVEQDENGGYTLDPQAFILALGGYSVAKAVLTHKAIKPHIKNAITSSLKQIEDKALSGDVRAKALLGIQAIVKSPVQKEKRGIFNVTFNGKNSTQVRKADLDSLIKYEKGNNKKGAIHIQKHLEDGSKGEVSTEELLNIGTVIRDGKFYNSYGKNIYELEKDGITFKAVTSGNKDERVITFYSDRAKGEDFPSPKGGSLSITNNLDSKNMGEGTHSMGGITSTSPTHESIIAKDETKNQIFSHGALASAGATNGFTLEDDGSLSFDSQDMLKGMAIGAGLEIFGSRLLKGGSASMRRGSIGIKPDLHVNIHSRASEVIEAKMPNKITPSALKSMLKKNGIKDEELIWSGISELKRGMVTKEEVNELIQANSLQLNEIIKKDPTTQKYIAYTEEGGTNYKEILVTLPEIEGAFKSSHWDETNVVAFIRQKDRVIDGKKTLFIEEIQSDWHQTGKKEGYQNTPQAPFKKSWHELAVKRVIKDAVDNGYEQISWTTAKQQEKRYSLGKSLEEVSYKINDDQTYTLEILHKNGARDRRAYINKIDLQDHIGQDLALRVANAEGEGLISGKNLVIPNEGMKVFYDKMIPSAVKKFLKTSPKKVKHNDQEVWVAKIKDETRKLLRDKGLPLFSLSGAISLEGVSDGS